MSNDRIITTGDKHNDNQSGKIGLVSKMANRSRLSYSGSKGLRRALDAWKP